MLNLSFHKDRDVYSDGDVEQDILAYIEQGGEQDWERVLEADSRWPVFYHLHPARKNILNWYPFKEGAQVLEVGAGMGAVTGALCEKAAHVTAVELSLRRAEAIDKRCGGRDNLEVMVANFNDIVFDRQFDCITLVGVLEYASLYTRSENPFLDFLTKLKALLKPGGKLLIAIENKFGMKYFAGAPEDHTGRLYDGLGGYVQSGSGVRTFGHGEIQRLLDSAGFPKLKFYYPLPDYKFPNVIFTDAFLPDTESIQRNLFYYLADPINFNETEVYREVIRDDPRRFPFFANSFLVEAGQTEDFAKTQLVTFNIYRQPRYALMTKIEGGGVTKAPLSPAAAAHFEAVRDNIRLLKSLGFQTVDSDENGGISSRFVDPERLLQNEWKRVYAREGSAAAAAFLRRFFEHIRGKSLPGDSGDDIFRRHGIALNEEENAYVRGLSYLKYGFWDMLLKNCFYVDGSYHFFDQEWLEYNVPLEYIVYRNVLEFRLSEAETDALFDAFGIRHPRIFDALDTALMCAPRSKDSFFLRGYRKTADVLQQAGAERDALQKAMADKDRQIADLQNGLNGVFHSTSWKMTAPLRAVSKGIKFLGKG